jgi:Methyltransferase domain
MRRFYKCGYFDPICELAVDVFQKTISAIAHHGKRVIRVLEVGAGMLQQSQVMSTSFALLFETGTGLLTRYLCDSLKQRDDVVVQYVVSDVSFALANSAAKSTTYKYASAKTYDLSKPPKFQGLIPGSFDMVVGLHVLHATQEISSTLSFVRQLLVGGGSLLVIELDKSAWRDLAPTCLFHDFVFGSFPEWFDFRDGRDHCSLMPEDWGSSLRSSGYEAVQMSTGGGAEFLFTARKPPFDCLGSPLLDYPSPVFLTYKYGLEMELQREISQLDVNQHLFLWLLASDGVDGAAGMGLAQSLILEFSTWDIHVAIFEGIHDTTDRIDLVLRYQEYLDCDTAIRFSKDRLPHVFKVVPSPPPISNRANWPNTSLNIVHQQFPPLQEYQVAVDVSAWSDVFSSWRGFVGYINQTNDEGFSTGDLILGVVADVPMSNRIVCHSGQLTLIPPGMTTAGIADYVLAMAIIAITLGPSRISRTGPRRPQIRILLAARDELAQKMHSFLNLLQPLAHVEIDCPTFDTQFDWIVVDSNTALRRPEVAFWRGNVLVWDKVMREMFRTDPCSLGYSLQSVLELAAPLLSNLSSESRMLHPQDQVLSPSEILAPTENLMFDRNKAYILLGGVSDLGIYIALWMYEVSETVDLSSSFPNVMS